MMLKAIVTINDMKGCSGYVSKLYVVNKNETKMLLSQGRISEPTVITFTNRAISKGKVFKLRRRIPSHQAQVNPGL
jgi:hypothetical protein